MIPSLEEIICMLANGDCTPEQAMAWLAQHEASNAEAQEADRRLFAAGAMQGILAFAGPNGMSREALSAWSVNLADDMMAKLAEKRDG